MNYTTLSAVCSDQSLHISSAPSVASGGVNETVLTVDFSNHWDGFEKTAVFYRTEDSVYHVLMENDTCFVPKEVIYEPGAFYFGILGVCGDAVRTSEVVRYPVRKGASTESTAVADPTPDIYYQLLSRIAALEVSDGASAYELAVANGFEGTQEEWLQSLHGTDGGIIGTVSGVYAVIDKCSDRPFDELTLHGRSSQNGSPSPTAPAELLSVGDGGTVSLRMYGRNLFNAFALTEENATVSVGENGNEIRVTGSENWARVYYEIPDIALYRGKKLRLAHKSEEINQEAMLEIIVRTASMTSNDIPYVYELSTKERYIDVDIPPDASVVRVRLYAKFSNDNSDTENTCTYKGVMLSMDSGTQWEEYKESKTLDFNLSDSLRSLSYEDGDICDKAYLSRGVCVRQIGKKILDGTENWSMSGSDDARNRRFGCACISGQDKNIDVILSDRFPRVPNSTTGYSQGFGFVYYPANGWMDFVHTDCASAAQWKAWLAENPVTVYYPLAEPKEEHLSAEEISAVTAFTPHTPSATVMNDAEALMSIRYFYNNPTADYILDELDKKPDRSEIDTAGAVLLWEGDWAGSVTLTISSENGTEGCTGAGNISDYALVIVRTGTSDLMNGYCIGSLFSAGGVAPSEGGALRCRGFIASVSNNTLTMSMHRVYSMSPDSSSISSADVLDTDSITAVYGIKTLA